MCRLLLVTLLVSGFSWAQTAASDVTNPLRYQLTTPQAEQVYSLDRFALDLISTRQRFEGVINETAKRYFLPKGASVKSLSDAGRLSVHLVYKF